jgi:hypothetical protein
VDWVVIVVGSESIDGMERVGVGRSELDRVVGGDEMVVMDELGGC